MMSKEREDFLVTQYVWALQNDSGWAKLAFPTIKANYFGSFAGVCETYMLQTVKVLRRESDANEGLSLGERSYITLMLWEQADGNMNNPSDQFRMHQVRLSELRRQIPQHEKLQQEITQHQENATEHFAKVEAELNRIEQEKQMSQIAFQTKSYVYGMDVATMNEAQLIDAIKSVEAEIGNLGQVKTPSKKIDAKKAELAEMLGKIVETLDAK